MAVATVSAPTRRRVVQTQLTPTQVVSTIPFSASAQTQFRLDRTMYYRSLNLRLRGSVTTGATTTGAVVGAGDEWAVVKLIEIVANGGNVLRSITGEQLCILNYLLTGYRKQKNTLFGAAAAYAFDSTLPLWFILPGGLGKSPIDTTLNATLLSDLIIRITWGTALDVNSNTGTAATVFGVNPYIEVSSDLAFFLDKTIIPAYSLTQIQQQNITNNLAVNGAGSAGYLWQIPVGQTYAFFLLNTKKTGTNQDAASCLGTGLIQSGTNQLYNVDLTVERYMNQYRQYVPDNSFTQIFSNTVNNYDGWTLLVFPKQKLLTESLNLVNFQSCQLFLQNTGGTSGTQAVDLNIIPMSIIPTVQVTG